MQQFSIKAMERLSGIKAHTLRVWEQRYGILKPARKEGNHRFYSNEDLKTLLRVVHLYEKGHRIGEIAGFSEKKLQDLLDIDRQNGSSVRLFTLGLYEAIVDFDEDALDKVFRKITRQYGFSAALLDVVFPLLNHLGFLWMADRIAPGQEHFASNFILRKILHAKSEIERKQVNKPGLVMLFTPKGEYHELGLVFMSYLLRLNGFNTIYLGANTDIEIIELFYQRYRPTHLLVYLTGNLQDEEPDEYLERLVRQYPDARVVACGLVTRALQNIQGCLILRQGDDMLQFSRHLMDE
jgi:DNA-binding transcriptional MerR regulator